jgi:hypothetical protein
MFVKPVAAANTATAIDFVNNIFKEVGKFDEIVTDRGAQFKLTFQKHFREQGVKVHIAQASHFEGNGMIERSIKTIGEIQAKSGAKKENWDEFLPNSINQYNSTTHMATNECPGDVFLGKEWKCMADMHWKPPPRQVTPMPVVQKHLQNYQQKLKHQMNAKRHSPFEPGDSVAIVKRLANENKHCADRRFRSRKTGPYTVISFHGQGKYVVTDGIKQINANGHEMIPWKCDR